MKKLPEVKRIKTKDLSFDPNNPRFYRLAGTTSDDAVIEEMLDDERIQDLMASIGQKGYFEGEALLVTKENDRLIVVEGNRRLAAVKLLNKELEPPSRRREGVEMIRSEAIVKAPFELPCIEYPSRKDVMRYLGYRHITGIKEWDSLSKARYLEDIRQEFYKDLSDAEQMKSLARDIGSRTDYVAQLLTALGLYNTAENHKFFELPMSQKDIEFSYITTALNYKKITDWLGLMGRSDIHMEGLRPENVKKIFSWLFAKDQQGRTIIGESRNLDQLADIVNNDNAVAALESTGKLAEAYLYSEGPQEALTTTLAIALEKVQLAWKMLPTTKPLVPEHMELAEQLVEDARTIRTFLRDKLED